MQELDLTQILPKLAQIERGIEDYLTWGQTDTLRACINDSGYDDIWPLRLNVKSKYDIWEVLRYEKDAQASRLHPYKQTAFRCKNRTPAGQVPCISLIYAYQGSVECEVPDHYFLLREHELCLVNSDVLINCSSTQASDFFLTIFFNKLYLNNKLLSRFPSDSLFTPFFEQALFGSDHGMDHLVFDLEYAPRAVYYYMAAIETYLQNAACPEEMQSSLIYLVFCELERLWKKENPPVQTAAAGVTAYDIVNYISTHYKTVTMASISNHFHFHPDYMGKTIKSLLNKNFVDIVQDVRLTAACQLLRDSNMPVSQIVQEIGYQNSSHFYALFKNRYHCSPAEYRQDKKNSAT